MRISYDGEISMKKICIVLGTRPEIIKLSPVIKYCLELKINFFIINSNQHYSYELDKILPILYT